MSIQTETLSQEPAADPLADLLTSLDPKLRSLADAFRSVGVEDAATLLALSKVEFDELLTVDSLSAAMTPLQRIFLRTRLRPQLQPMSWRRCNRELRHVPVDAKIGSLLRQEIVIV